VPGIIVHIWTVGPIRVDGREIYSASAWCIRSLKTGVRVAKFSDFQVALNFAHWLWRNYGDITDANIRFFLSAETEADNRMFDEIEERSKHSTRLKDKEHPPFVRFDPARY
jgi:hypothetical protein